MRVGIYANAANVEAGALCSGLLSAGHRPVDRSLPDYGAGQVEPFDLVVTTGLRGKGASLLADYTAAGVPVAVLDFGYLSRERHFQLSPGGLNNIPAFACPADRLNALGLTVAVRGGDPQGYVLLLGQVPGDAAHGMSAAEHAAWLASVAAQYENVVYRPHPRGGVPVDGLREIGGSLDDALKGARLAVTWNSNAGHEALLAGVPVIAHGPAAYSELCGESLPSVEARRAYFARVAYGQWTLAELADGTAARFLLDHHLPGVAVELPAEAPQAVPMKRRRARGA